ncbi:MAG TPA: hypothetical protein VF266_20115 [Thermoanaerobaculia bacterium]
MRPGAAVLATLRANPKTAIAAWGFVVRGGALLDDIGGACALSCDQFRQTSIYQITVQDGAGDYYIPYGDRAARYCDVPTGLPDGTLVVTFPMNGCALEVRDVNGVNRFYHDADGNSMPLHPPGILKFRAASADYEGAERTTHMRALRYFSKDVQDKLEVKNRGGYEHDVICVKRGTQWQVYSSANILLNGDAWQVKDRVPSHLGSFDD